MQDHPGAPGTARQESTRTIVSTYDGGIATQQRAPGHERPRTASSGAARHGRLSAASTAPGADIPRATSARAPGQYCQSAAPRAPGHGRPLAIAAGAPCRDRLSAAPLAPDDDAVPAIAAIAPRHHRPSAAPIATVALPAGQHRLRQVSLPRTPATPNTLTNPHTHQDTAHTHTAYRRATRYAQSRPRPSARRSVDAPSKCQEKGPGVRLSALLLPIKCILPSRFRPSRGLAPPRPPPASASTPPAPRRYPLRHCGAARTAGGHIGNSAGHVLAAISVIAAQVRISTSPRE